MWNTKNHKPKKLIISILIVTTILATLLSGCVGEEETSTIVITGSTTVLPIAETCAVNFKQMYSNITVTVSGGGSSQGIADVASGNADIGDASRNKKESDVKNTDGSYKYKKSDGTDVTLDDLVDNVIALDGVAVVVSAAIYETVTGITMDELFRIYTGNISNWQELGGPDEEIFVNDRASTSGTRASFLELVKSDDGNTLQKFEEEGEDLAIDKVNQENADVVDAVSNSDQAIGYVGLGYVNPNTCPAIMINGIEPSLETITGGTYPISRSLHMYTLGQPTGVVKMFIDYVLSTEGQTVVEDEGFIPIA